LIENPDIKAVDSLELYAIIISGSFLVFIVISVLWKILKKRKKKEELDREEK